MSRFIADPESVVRAVLGAPCELSHRDVSGLVGVAPTTVKEIRLGEKWAHIAPHIARFETMARSCTGCTHWAARRMRATATEPARSGLCQLGIPEAANVYFGRGCSAWAEARP